MNAETLEAIRALSPIGQIVGEHIQLRRSGVQLVGRCPLHFDKTPSFYVHPGKQVFHCHGCGRGGDVFEFARLLHGCSFREAVQHLAQRAGILIDRFHPSLELTAKVTAMAAQRQQQMEFEHFCNHRVEAISQKFRALGRAATHAESYLQAGGSDPYIHDLAWNALERFREFGARIEREGLLDIGVLRGEWQAQRGEHVAAV